MLVDSLLEALGNQALQDFLAYFFRKLSFDERLGNLASTEAWNTGELLVTLGDVAEGFRYFVSRNFDGDLSGELWVQRWALLVVVLMQAGS